jgi:hypothetical protein
MQQAPVQRPMPRASERRASSSGRRRSPIRPWMVIAVILILAVVGGILVAMSGPDVSAVPPK